MTEMRQSRFIQQQPQQQQKKPSIMGSLFSLFQQVAPLLGPEAMMASKAGGALFGQGTGGLVSSIAGAMGDSNGDGSPDSGTPAEMSKPGDGQQPQPVEVPKVDSTTDEAEAVHNPEEEKVEGSTTPNPLDSFSSMTVQDLLAQYPEMRNMFAAHIKQQGL